MLLWSRRILAGLNILNWATGIPIVVAFGFVGFGAPDAFVAALRDHVADPAPLLLWLRWITLITAPVILLAHIILTRLIAMIDDARAGTPFARANAIRLRHIAWALLGIQLLDFGYGLASIRASEMSGEYLGWSFGLTGGLAVLLLFVLARVFERGSAMQDELAEIV